MQTALKSLAALFPPNPDALLDLLRSEITEDDLIAIAEADYGYRAEDHVEPLARIWITGRIPVHLDWFPREVLQLTRWTEPDSPAALAERSAQEWHRIRAFACTILLRNAANLDAEYGEDESDTLVQMLSSALHLGISHTTQALRFLLWRYLNRTDNGGLEERAFFWLGVLIAYTWLPVEQSRETVEEKSARLIRLVEEAEAVQSMIHRANSRQRNSFKFLWRKVRVPDLADGGIRREVWEALIRSILIASPVARYSPEAEAVLAKIGQRVLSESRRA